MTAVAPTAQVAGSTFPRGVSFSSGGRYGGGLDCVGVSVGFAQAQRLGTKGYDGFPGS